jgi:hypothetical protein
VELTGTGDIVAGSITFSGAHQTIPIGGHSGSATGTATADVSVDLVGADGVVLGVVAVVGADEEVADVGTGLTVEWNRGSGGGDEYGVRGIAVTKSGGGTPGALSFPTPVYWSASAVEINSAGEP